MSVSSSPSYCLSNLFFLHVEKILILLQEWDIKMSPSKCTEVLLSIRNIASRLSSMPGNCGIQGESYYWSAGYPLNMRLYEKLLLGVFDILEDGQLIEVSVMSFNLLCWLF